ncbi:MAG: ABC transporter permease subunit [Alphaproteobacteria bacterium]|nr:ABC transporter permease subunit [Alphaproteobacteria bacterium]
MEKRVTFNNLWIAAAFIAPQLFLVFTFFYWPTGQALYWSLTLEPPFGGGNQFVGLQNFKAVFADPHYWDSVIRSVIFAITVTLLSVGFAAVLALFADRNLRGHQLYKFLYFLPYAVPAAAVGLAFRFTFTPEAGFLGALNHLHPGLWDPTRNGWQALLQIILGQSWKMAGYNFIFLLAALQSVPRPVIEAAAMDGAGVLRRMREIQLPLITPTFFFLFVINITDSFVDSFGMIDVTTKGGPSRATELMVYKIYLDGFESKDYSLAAAQSIILMLLIVVMTVLQFRFVERRVHYS